MHEIFFIIKPDAIANNIIREQIYDEINKYSVVITKVIKRKLTTQEVDLFWPQSQKSQVLNGLLKCYMTLSDCEVVFLLGNLSLKRINELKKGIRERFAICKFANCMHTPANNYELIQQAACLKHKVEHADKEINQIALNIWKIVNKYGWDYKYSKYQGKKHAIYLINDNYNTIDHVAETISNVLKIYTLEISYILALQVDVYEKILLFDSDDWNEIEYIGNKLVEDGLNIKIKKQL